MTERAFNARKRLALFDRHPVANRARHLPRWLFHAVSTPVRELARLRKRLAELKHATDNLETLGDVFDKLQSFPEFRSCQKRSEVLGLLDLLARNPPQFLCEIGSATGGTLFLLAKVCVPDATIISVDLGLPLVRRLIHRRLGVGRQRIICLRGDSRSPETLNSVASMLRRNRLDCLFIDGDHSYEGVAADFVNYRPFVKAGGVVVFHDIVPDHKTRYGIETENYTGCVPQYWDETKTKYPGRIEEFVADPNQDGFGIGVIRLSAGG